LVVAIELANEEEESLASKTGSDRAAVTLNVGRVEGGTTHNTVAADAELVIEMRADAGAAYRRGLAKLAAAILAVDAECGSALPCDEATLHEAAALCEALPAAIRASSFAERQAEGITVAVEERVRALPWQRTEEADAVLAHIAATAAELGVACKVQLRGGLSDANNLWALAPTVDALGPHGLGAHRAEPGDSSSPAEKVHWPSLIPKAVLLAEAVSRIC
jgi:acetylornithine deacetylase/succinyl-diaminopimelate desuccinylase-like protein